MHENVDGVEAGKHIYVTCDDAFPPWSGLEMNEGCTFRREMLAFFIILGPPPGVCIVGCLIL